MGKRLKIVKITVLTQKQPMEIGSKIWNNRIIPRGYCLERYRQGNPMKHENKSQEENREL